MDLRTDLLSDGLTAPAAGRPPIHRIRRTTTLLLDIRSPRGSAPFLTGIARTPRTVSVTPSSLVPVVTESTHFDIDRLLADLAAW